VAVAAEASTPLKVGVVGTGALGRHHVRIMAELAEADLVGIVDLRADVAAELAGRHGTVAMESLDQLAESVDAAVVAVPTSDHLTVARRLLEKGVHVLVEKPITPTLEEADALLAAAGDRVVAVGHVEFYNPAVQALMTVRGRPGYVEIQRLAAFTPRSLDVDVVLDLMIHDLQILHAVDPSPVSEVRATGVQVLSERIDIANVRLELASGCVANLTASRVSAERVRKLRVFLRDSYYSLDYQAQEIKGYELVGDQQERAIRPVILPVESAEPLKVEARHFLAACRGRDVPLVNAVEGRRALATALEILDAIDRKREVARR
jgi:predicted dehydrogenase